MKNLPFHKITATYAEIIHRNCLGPDSTHTGLPYWQNRLFALILMYLLPLCLLAIIPGVIMSLVDEAIFLAVYDILVFFALALISFSRGLSISLRKTIFIVILYSTAIILLYYLGSFGPGLLYLLAVTIFTTLILSRWVTYWSVVLNAVICIVFGIAIHFKLINSPLIPQYSLGSWIAVSSNLILLSLIITSLLPTIFKGLQNIIDMQEKLKIQLKIEQRDLEQTIEKVNHKNAELEEFAYVASHDMQEPLRTISGLLTQLEKSYKPQLDEKARRYIHFAIDGAERMKKIISDLLDYSMAEKKVGDIHPVNMNLLVQEYVDQNREFLEEKKAVITWDQLPVVGANRLSLQQLLQNLLSNAIKYQKKEENPLINITCAETNRYWQFIFSDNGIGIAPEFFDKIFVVFQRLHDKSEYPGTGIGLAICKKIVENHKGKIWVESIPERGSTFYFTISKHLN